jgi:hypothetical protein
MSYRACARKSPLRAAPMKRASVAHLCRVSPVLSFAKLRSDKNETKHHGSRGRARLLQAICRVFDDPSVLALLTRRTYAMHRSLPSLN